MNALAVLIPVSIGMGLVGLLAFVWALRHHQFDDPEGAAARVLVPDIPVSPRKGDADGRLASDPDHPHPAGGL